MRRLDRGTGCGARGARSQASHSGGIGAPPGTTKSPCQELADDGGAFERRWKTGKRGPMSNKRCDWRAERRPPRSARIADTTGLRFSARHPLIIDEGITQSPDASRIAATIPHGSLTSRSRPRGAAHHQQGALSARWARKQFAANLIPADLRGAEDVVAWRL